MGIAHVSATHVIHLYLYMCNTHKIQHTYYTCSTTGHVMCHSYSLVNVNQSPGSPVVHVQIMGNWLVKTSPVKDPTLTCTFMAESLSFATTCRGRNLFILNVRTVHGSELHCYDPLGGMSEIVLAFLCMCKCRV